MEPAPPSSSTSASSSLSSRGSTPEPTDEAHKQQFHSPLCLALEQIATITATHRDTSSAPIALRSTDDIVLAPKADLDFWQVAVNALMTCQHRPMDFNKKRFISSALVSLSNHHRIDTSPLIPLLVETVDRKAHFLADILQTRMVTSNADDRQRVSFQYVIVPLIGLLTRERVCNSPNRGILELIYRTVYKFHNTFFIDGVIPCLESLVSSPLCSMQLHTAYARGGKNMPRPGVQDCKVESLLAALIVVIRLYHLVAIHAILDNKGHLEHTAHRIIDISKRYLQHRNRPPHERADFVEVLKQDMDKLQEYFQDFAREHVNSSPNSPNPAPLHNNTSFNFIPTGELVLGSSQTELPLFVSPQEPGTQPLTTKLIAQLSWYFDEYLSQIRETVHDTTQPIDNAPQGAERPTIMELNKNMDIHIYHHVRFRRFSHTVNPIGTVMLELNQHQHLAQLTEEYDRTTYWETSRSMMPGSVLLLYRIDHNSTESTIPRLIPVVIKDWNAKDIAEGAEYFQIGVQLTVPDHVVDVVEMTEKSNHRWIAIDIRHPYYASFIPVLKMLDYHRQHPELLPFARFLAPTTNDNQSTSLDGFVHIRPPKYARKPGFTLDLEPISPRTILDPNNGISIQRTKDRLISEGNFDKEQAITIVDILSREIMLIEGPPGTGKSHVTLSIIKVLVYNRQNIGSGPIIVVSHSNFAVDELLEKIITGDKLGQIDVVRVGCQSKSEILKKKTLQHLMGKCSMTIKRKRQRNRLSDLWDMLHARLHELVNALHTEMTDIYTLVEGVVKRDNSDLSQQFRSATFRTDNVGSRRKADRPVDEVYQRWLSGAGPGYVLGFPRPPAEVEDIWTMSKDRRKELAETWSQGSLELWREQLVKAAHEIASLVEEQELLKDASHLDLLRNVHVIGLTTNSLSRHHSVIEALEPMVHIYEEAGRTFEPHTIAGLTQYTQHAIFLGDTQQLPPPAMVHHSSKQTTIGQVNLDQSAFYHLLHMDPPLPRATLKTQWRMETNIADIVRALYPHIVDDVSAHQHPTVKGIIQNLYFIDHCGEEHFDEASNSIFNEYEANSVVATALYLYKLGYRSPGQLAIFTPYKAQEHRIRQLLSRLEVPVIKKIKVTMAEDNFQGSVYCDGQIEQDEDDFFSDELVEVTVMVSLAELVTFQTVDSCQGREAHVVLISLVRNVGRDKTSIGFLDFLNRVSVAISRAKDGLYFWGNAELMESHESGYAWQRVMVMRMTNMSPTNASTPRHRPDHQTLRLKISLNTLVDNDPILLQYVAHSALGMSSSNPKPTRTIHLHRCSYSP
ncbi:hypothetical protein CPC16_008961 [Podila verticillata]|nr:hypothetical protein CPC16_008961 [Podila verticillata]